MSLYLPGLSLCVPQMATSQWMSMSEKARSVSGRLLTHEEATGWVSISPETQQLGRSGPGPTLALGVFALCSTQILGLGF